MTNDPTTTPNGEADMPSITKGRANTGRRNSGQADLHPGMMGDGTEEQNLGQRGNPSARITEDEVQAAFGKGEPRSFAAAREDDYYAEASGEDDRISAITDRISAMRDQVQQSADAAKAWASRQAEAARQTAVDKPVLVISASAGIAMAVGLMAGFCLGRATADDY